LQFNIPRGADGDLSFILSMGDVLYLLGANGTGKSGLISRLFNAHQASAKRISAHRQTWFQSNSLDMSPMSRENLERTIRSQDAQEHARYRLDYANERAGVAIYDLIDSDTTMARRIAELVRAGDISSAQKEAKKPSPLQEINELMRLSNIPIEISLEEGQKVVAKKMGGPGYSVAELSDGERNAFLIAADILTSKPGTLILIDEPERHLHRSIISPLLKLLFDKRKDCAFIISTHELMLPLDTPGASTLLVRACQYSGRNLQSWTVDMLGPEAQIDEDLKRHLLGSRRKLIFVEGTPHSLDAALYSLLFPLVSIIPKENCRDVEHAVRGLRSAENVHWVAAWGIVDNDQRAPDDITRLKEAGVWALSHYSVESLYYHPSIVTQIAARQAEVLGGDAEALVAAAMTGAVGAAKGQRDHLVASAVVRSARNKFLGGLPNRKDVQAVSSFIKVEVDVQSLRAAEEARFDGLIAASDWDGLLTRYPLRESSAFDRVVDGLKLKDQATYLAAVLKLLQDSDSALTCVRTLLGGLYADVSS
jgi:ABC-type cobalamin/Fe3+-siderophores transport system ATPase subunit